MIRIFIVKPIVLILALALVLRLWGIDYGLPFLLVNDEPAIVLGALKMLEMKNPIPVFNDAEFRTVLYYPPFPSQALALFLIPVIGIHYLLAGAPPLAEYRALVALDPTVIWIASRLVWVFLGLGMVFLTYRLGRALFGSERAGLLAAIFLALSPYHIYLSQTVRHWLPAALAMVILWLLALRMREGSAGRGTYLAAGLVAGSAAGGINTAGAVGLIPALAAHWFAVAGGRWRERLGSPALFVFLGAFAASALLFFAAYPYGLTRAELGPGADAPGYVASLLERISAGRSGLGEFLAEYGRIFLWYEPAIAAAGAAGIVLALRNRDYRFWAVTFAVFAALYFALLFLFFNVIPRGIVFVLPLLAIFAGYAADRLILAAQNSIRPTLTRSFVLLVSCFLLLFFWPLLTDLRYAWLLARPDTRLAASRWIGENIPAGEKILLDSQYLRLFETAESAAAVNAIDHGALRSHERAILVLPPERRPEPAYQVLNLHFLSPERPERTIFDPAVFRDRGFRYLVVEHDHRDGRDLRPETRSLLAGATVVARFDPWIAPRYEALTASGEISSVPLTALFGLERFGNFIVVAAF